MLHDSALYELTLTFKAHENAYVHVPKYNQSAYGQRKVLGPSFLKLQR